MKTLIKTICYIALINVSISQGKKGNSEHPKHSGPPQYVNVTDASITDIKLITGKTDGTGVASLNYPAGFNWENTHVLSVKVRSKVGGRAMTWYRSTGNFNTSGNSSIQVDLRNELNPTKDDTIYLKISGSEYVSTEFAIAIMRLK